MLTTDTETWTPAVHCDLNEGPNAFAGAVKRFREWSANKPLLPITITTGWCVITPQLAEELLKRNRRNRKLRYNDVLRYSQQMLNKRWKKTGEPVIMTDRGEVDDAAHRLFACYFSGASFETFVVTDVPHDDQLFAYIDNGVSRTAEDTMICAGLNGMSATIASVIKDFAIRYDENTLTFQGRLPMQSPVTNIDVLDYARANPEIADTIKLVKDVYPAAVKRLGDLKITSFVAWKISQAYGTTVLDEYMAQLTQADLPAGHPVAVLQKRLDEHVAATEAARRSPKVRFKLTPVQIVALAMRAFNLAQAGATVRQIVPRTDDPFPRIERRDEPDMADAAE